MRKINRTIDEKYKACPIRNVIEKFGDKWSLLVLYHLNERGTMRFNDLGRDMSDCSQKMLSQTLKRLEQIGLVARQVYPEVPPRVEYSITELGKSLMPHVIGLMEWATQNFENIVRNEGDL
ncbi:MULTISPECIES: helix-turn-helix domain-containing protein [unclassified Bacteroides]|jgi:DNA-binding HxlR family transcriptional regulator|uniref:winged helix-turn-helix transcriptional regulator n=1 Tax=unclassified Bacteroides TaxID=2646097 RepID=UPI0004E1ED2A|nr:MULTISPECIES: helix-turn-helix domain-containing protein [unclassified Bacteroides]MEE1260681.1 helix-turn-helix domain-containing protein [Paludibacteraceae bacterium]